MRNKPFLGSLGIYWAFAAMWPKVFFAYTAWVWVEFILQIISMTIFVFFWRAVYAGQSTVGGLSLGATLNYILLAQFLMPLIMNRLIFFFGQILRSGELVVELARPIDFQAGQYTSQLANLVLQLVIKLPILLIAIVVFGLQLPSDPWLYPLFLISLFLGHAVLFFFDWTFSCIAFYTTEVWGLSVVREGVALFFSGALVPLAMMPGWLQNIANALPFAQAIYVPVSLLSGITPPANAPQALLVQTIWLVGLLVLSRLAFAASVRVVTVQGG